MKYSKFGFRRKIQTIKMKENNLNDILICNCQNNFYAAMKEQCPK